MVATFPGCKACWGSALGSEMTRQATLLPKRINSYLSDCHFHSSFASWQSMLIAEHSLSCLEATVCNNVWPFARLSVILVRRRVSHHIVLLLGRHLKISTESATVRLEAIYCYYLACGRLGFCCLVGCHWGHCQIFFRIFPKKLKNILLLMLYVCTVNMKLQLVSFVLHTDWRQEDIAT